MTTIPVPCRWEGDSFVPLPRFAAECDKAFVVGEVYGLVTVEDRSPKSHRHYFAAINGAWQNLPDRLAEQFPSADHLRKFALIKAGFADSRQLVASSKAEAMRLAVFIRPCDEYAVVTVSEAVVTIFTARSQSVKAMGKQEFQRSKDEVLRIVAEMIGTTPQALTANASQAA